jgi:hypothetical protein
VTGQHTRSFSCTIDSTADSDVTIEFFSSRFARHPSAVRCIDILSSDRVRAKSEKIGISCRYLHAASRDGHIFAAMNNLEPLL